MDKSIKALVLRVLEIIDYREDKMAFADKFLLLVERATRIDLILSLPREKQDIIIQELREEKDIAKIQETFKKYFTTEQIEGALERVTQKEFRDFMLSVIPSLSDSQKKLLEKVVEEKTH